MSAVERDHDPMRSLIRPRTGFGCLGPLPPKPNLVRYVDGRAKHRATPDWHLVGRRTWAAIVVAAAVAGVTWSTFWMYQARPAAPIWIGWTFLVCLCLAVATNGLGALLTLHVCSCEKGFTDTNNYAEGMQAQVEERRAMLRGGQP